MIKSEDIDRLYDTLKVAAYNRNFTHTDLTNFTSKLAETLFPYEKFSTNIIDLIVERYEENLSIKSYTPDVLVNFENDPEWFYKMKKDQNQKHEYFKRYKEFLRRDDFAEDSIDRIETVSEKVLACCAKRFEG